MTKTVLHIDSSARHQGSVSRELSRKAVDALKAEKTIERDLSTGVDLVDENWIFSAYTAPDERSDEQKARLGQSDALIAELQEADTIVIGVPTYNFGIPASLKLWIDQIARVGVTFRYNENGQPIGLLENKKAIVVFTSAGVPMGSPMDFVTPYLKLVLGFIGITDVEIVNADQNLARAETVISESEARIQELA